MFSQIEQIECRMCSSFVQFSLLGMAIETSRNMASQGFFILAFVTLALVWQLIIQKPDSLARIIHVLKYMLYIFSLQGRPYFRNLIISREVLNYQNFQIPFNLKPLPPLIIYLNYIFPLIRHSRVLGIFSISMASLLLYFFLISVINKTYKY